MIKYNPTNSKVSIDEKGRVSFEYSEEIKPIKEANRDMVWRKSVRELWHRFNDGGVRYWNTLSDTEKESALQAIDRSIVQEQERLAGTDAPEYPTGTQTIGINKVLRVFFTPEGKIKTKIINGKE